jgi:hypothetical protein
VEDAPASRRQTSTPFPTNPPLAPPLLPLRRRLVASPTCSANPPPSLASSSANSVAAACLLYLTRAAAVRLPCATVGLDKVTRRPSLLLPINARAPEPPRPPHRHEGATAPPLLPMAPAPPGPSHRREGTGALLPLPPPARGRHSVPFHFLQREDAALAPASPPPRRARRAAHSPSTPARGRRSVPSHFLQREDAAPLLLLPHRV